jgi:hypothetical protein
VASGQIQFHFARKKETFAFASGQPLFSEKQKKEEASEENQDEETKAD